MNKSKISIYLNKFHKINNRISKLNNKTILYKKQNKLINNNKILKFLKRFHKIHNRISKKNNKT